LSNGIYFVEFFYEKMKYNISLLFLELNQCFCLIRTTQFFVYVSVNMVAKSKI
jgi:hypothetical protein